MILTVYLLPESRLRTAVDLLVRLVEACRVVVIFTGAVIAFVRFVVGGLRERRAEMFA